VKGTASLPWLKAQQTEKENKISKADLELILSLLVSAAPPGYSMLS
jgi:hypothetical protein